MDEIPDVRLELLKTTFFYHKLFQQILDHGNEKVHLFQVLQAQNLGQQNVVEFEVEVIYIHLIMQLLQALDAVLFGATF